MADTPFKPGTIDIRADKAPRASDDELRTSLQQNGWLLHLPAIKDENGRIVVGNRRMKIATDLGIEPVVELVHFGSGLAADAERIKLAVGSNLGRHDNTDRKRLAVYLYEQGLTQQRIAEALGVSQGQISIDLKTLLATNKVSRVDRLGRKNTGRPKAPPKPREPKYSRAKEDRVAELVVDERKTWDEVRAETGVSATIIRKAKAREQGRREARREFIEAAPVADRAAIERVLRKEFEEAYQRKLDEALLGFVAEEWFPAVKSYLDEARKVVEKSREPMFTEEQYNALLKCTHGSPSDRTRGFATRILTTYKHVLLGFDKAKLSRVDAPRMPVLNYTLRQLDAMRRKVQRERSDKRRRHTLPAA
jgi:predicted ArsR family transcriptional regulator